MTGDKIIGLDDHRPHTAKYFVCMTCAKDWIAVAPVNAGLLECPKCSAMAGEVVKPYDIEWFKRFMRGKHQKRRTYVLLNAARIQDD